MRPDRRTCLLGAGAGLLTAALPSAAVGAGERGRVREVELGQGTLVAIEDGALTLGPQDFRDVDEAEAEALLSQGGGSSLNAFLFRDGTRNVLIDAGGAGFLSDAGGLTAALETLDLEPRQIDTILLTHLHVDHIGGLMADGERVFPFAEIQVQIDEVRYWNSPLEMRQAPEFQHPTFEAVRDLFSAYGYRIKDFSAEGEVIPGVAAVPLPGHSPGHTGYLVGEGPDAVLVWGDLVHSAALQFPHPGSTFRDDVDAEQAAETRLAVLDRVVAEDRRVAGMHLPFPGIGRVVREGETYRWKGVD
ncbi:MAG: MBL fold metallo-hydrolase [Paracoccaceae bacterium]